MHIGQLVAQRCAELGLDILQVAERMIHAGYHPVMSTHRNASHQNRSRLNDKVFREALAAALGLNVEDMLSLLEDRISRHTQTPKGQSFSVFTGSLATDLGEPSG
jgi:hypothetical protein